MVSRDAPDSGLAGAVQCAVRDPRKGAAHDEATARKVRARIASFQSVVTESPGARRRRCHVPEAGARSRRRDPGDLTTGCDTSASPLTPAFPDARSLGVPARSSAAGATAAITSKGGLAVAIRASGKPDMRKFPSVRSTRTKIERKRPSAKVLLELVAARATGVVSGRRPRCSRAR